MQYCSEEGALKDWQVTPRFISPGLQAFNTTSAAKQNTECSSPRYSQSSDSHINSNQGGRFNNNSKLEQKLAECIKKRDMSGIEKCIAYGASVQTSTYKQDPPIMVAIECGYRDITKLLLEHKGLDLNEKARNGMLPLGYACMCGKTEIVEVLLKAKANLNAQDAHGETALIKAVTNSHLAITNILLKKGADANIQNSSGITPLHIAIIKSNEPIVKALLASKKIDITIENKSGQTAEHLVEIHPNAEIKNMLSSKK